MATTRIQWFQTAMLATASALLLCAGCGRNTPDLISVRGKVTLAGGNWPKPGTLTFVPMNSAPGRPFRPGSAEFDTDGNFEAVTGEAEGLIPGEYQISIECWEKVPRGSGGGVSYLDLERVKAMQKELILKVDAQSDPVIWEKDFPPVSKRK